MSIIVVCPKCLKSFKVSDQFAGRSGPCPGCKHTLQVPSKSEEVEVHAPEAFAGGGRSTTGKLITKPVARTDAKMRPVVAAAIVAAVLVVLALTWLGGRAGLFQSTIATSLGLLLISPPLVIAAYNVLHNDELEPYFGVALYIRSAICALAYMALWGVFLVLASRGVITGDMWNWIMVAPPFFLIGGLMAQATLDFEFGDGIFHYSFYLLATLLLRWVAGMTWIWDVT